MTQREQVFGAPQAYRYTVIYSINKQLSARNDGQKTTDRRHPIIRQSALFLIYSYFRRGSRIGPLSRVRERATHS